MPNNNIDKELEVAVYEKNLKEVKALLSAGANPNIIAERNQFRGTLLHATSNVEIAKELISYGAMVDARNMYVRHHCIGLQ
ncbi:MAG: hypothetical protein ACR5K6_03640 [Wolbachia sp.]